MKKIKYIFISGGVISGIGKGTTSASISLLLKNAGYIVSPLKFENYLNIDAGTINPVEHGDPFLCEDGTEADMDIGTYEKFLDKDMGRYNFVTMGAIYKAVIDRERRFEYHGEDVEAIPYITNEISDRIAALAKKDNSDIVTIELGGTAGEYQNVFYYEAARMMTLKYPGDVVHIHVSYVPTPHHLGEPKTKPTQLSVRTLNSMGIQPDFIVARSERQLDQRRKDRFALFCNMHSQDIISNPDLSTVYDIPSVLDSQGLTRRIQEKLQLPIQDSDMDDWSLFLERFTKKHAKTIEIGIVGKYFGTGDYQLKDSYAALFDAIDHAAAETGVGVKTRWIDAEQIEKHGTEIIGNPSGIIVPIGWGERGTEGMIQAACYARQQTIPYLGLCYGMQLAVVAFARDVIGWTDAHTTEVNPETPHPVIHIIDSQKELLKRRAYGGTMRLGAWKAIVQKDTRAYELYDRYGGFIDKEKGLTSERHRHRYEFNNDYLHDFENNGLRISARSVEEELVEIVEIDRDKHPFFFGTQGHPEYKSRPISPHPIFLGFMEACKEND